MTALVIDDHLLRDLLSEQLSPDFQSLVDGASVYTTNLWYLRLCRSTVASAGGRLTGALSARQRQALGRALITLPEHVGVVPFADLSWQMAERHAEYALSTLSCEALVAAEQLGGSIVVWRGDDGPNLRAACRTVGVRYDAVS